MNKTLAEEELDRELVLNAPKCDRDGSSFGWTINKAKVSKKTLIFETGYGKRFRFEKRRFIGSGLQIGVEWDSQKTERCSLGHDHPVGKKETRREEGTLNWEYVEQLIDWLNEGSFQQVSGKTPGWVNIFKEVDDLFKMIEPTNKVLAASCQKIRAKMKYQLKEEGIQE